MLEYFPENSGKLFVLFALFLSLGDILNHPLYFNVHIQYGFPLVYLLAALLTRLTVLNHQTSTKQLLTTHLVAAGYAFGQTIQRINYQLLHVTT